MVVVDIAEIVVEEMAEEKGGIVDGNIAVVVLEGEAKHSDSTTEKGLAKDGAGCDARNTDKQVVENQDCNWRVVIEETSHGLQSDHSGR